MDAAVAVHDALVRCNGMVQEMNAYMEEYEACVGYSGGEISKEIRYGHAWGLVERLMWSVWAKSNVEGLRKEVMTRMVEINMLLSLTRCDFRFRYDSGETSF